MGQALEKLTIQGFKSIESLVDFEPGNLTVLIGANGSGKSNFVDFFRMIIAMSQEAFQKYANNQGEESLFFLGPKFTPQIKASLGFVNSSFHFALELTAQGKVVISEAEIIEPGIAEAIITEAEIIEPGKTGEKDKVMWAGVQELIGFGTYPRDHDHLPITGPLTENMKIYHINDTSGLAPMMRESLVQDDIYLREDGANLPAYLLMLKNDHEKHYLLIRDTIRLAAPFFDDFLLRSKDRGGLEKVRLEWMQKGNDFPFQSIQLSDGTIRFICLVTALMQPDPPSMIILDEPELGLHPFAINLLADLIKSASERTQVIVSTQSPQLLDHFDPEHIVVVNRKEGRSVFERLSSEQLEDWLKEYTVGELWQKNVVQGGPVNE